MLSAVAHAHAMPADDGEGEALDAFDDADDDELALDQEVRTVTDQRGLGESRKRYCGFQIFFFLLYSTNTMHIGTCFTACFYMMVCYVGMFD